MRKHNAEYYAKAIIRKFHGKTVTYAGSMEKVLMSLKAFEKEIKNKAFQEGQRYNQFYERAKKLTPGKYDCEYHEMARDAMRLADES